MTILKDVVVVVNSEKDHQKFLAKRKEIFDKLALAISKLQGIKGLENKASHVLTFEYDSVHFDLLLGYSIPIPLFVSKIFTSHRWNAVEGLQEGPHLNQHSKLIEVIKNIKDHTTHKLLSPSFVDSITDWVLHQKPHIIDAIILGKVNILSPS